VTDTLVFMPTDEPEPLPSTDTAEIATPTGVHVTATHELADAAPQCTAIGQTWTRPVDGMVMVCVPAGEFVMGDTGMAQEEYVDECVADGHDKSDCESWVSGQSPTHTVYLDAFWIDKYEVSNKQYRMCVEAGACEEEGCPNDQLLIRDSQPVVCVWRQDAEAYAEWVGGKLPTEAQWEKACRGEGSQAYPWGSAFDPERVNFCDRNCTFEDERAIDLDDGYKGPARVQSYPQGASPYGALNMLGNVWEWVADLYDPGYYAASPYRNPQGPAEVSTSGLEYVQRGGSFLTAKRNVRCTFRGHIENKSLTDIGFRVVVDAGPSGP
jgi:formylglycine-generating enzyme required for sulfatase activity